MAMANQVSAQENNMANIQNQRQESSLLRDVSGVQREAAVRLGNDVISEYEFQIRVSNLEKSMPLDAE